MFPWHQPVVQQLTALRDTGQLPNAIALTCPPGWGHQQLLSQVALQLLHSDSRQPIEEFAHPDFRWLAAEGAVIKIEQIRKIVDFAVQTAQLAPRKVAAICDAHLLNANAANALLKTLEEPPPDTHVLLATSSWGKLIPTIRSRCQRFQVMADQRLAEDWLSEQGVAISAMDFALAGGAPLAALSQHEAQQVAQQETRSETQPPDGQGANDLTTWLTELSTKNLATAVQEAMDDSAVDLLGRWYRRLLLSLYQAPLPGLKISEQQIHGFCERLLSVRRQIETSNSANVRLLFEALIVEWCRLAKR